MCYTVPLGVAVITTALQIKKKEKNSKLSSLNLMLYGGSLFGTIDHLWNGELFLIGNNLVKDLLLGFIITASIFTFWGIQIFLTKRNFNLTGYLMAPKS